MLGFSKKSDDYGELLSSFKNEGVSSKAKIAMEGYTESDIKNFLGRLGNETIKQSTMVITPLLLTVDLSGSMDDDYDKVKSFIKELCNRLEAAGARRFIVILNVVYNGKTSMVYFDELDNLDPDQLVKALPDSCFGGTPLLKAMQESTVLLTRLNETLEAKRFWYTVPLMLTITDDEDNMSENSAMRHIKKMVADAKLIVLEFAPSTRAGGLDLGGYKFSMDEFSEAAKVITSASSTTNQVGGVTLVDKPHKSDREAYNKYMSETLLANMRHYYDQRYKI